MLNADPADSSRPASSSSSAIQADGEVYQDDTNTNAHAQPSGSNFTKKKTRRKRRGGKGQSNVQGSKYADKCMYAELLEMRADVPWDNNGHAVDDGLPDDLESGWVAVAPVPAGKRCLVVSYQSSGVAGNGE
jgi:snurportin-1